LAGPSDFSFFSPPPPPFFLFDGTGLTKQALYCLSHTSSPFFSGYFEDEGLWNYFPRLALNCDPPEFSFPSRFSPFGFLYHSPASGQSFLIKLRRSLARILDRPDGD
jgi:hypothetical protein